MLKELLLKNSHIIIFYTLIIILIIIFRKRFTVESKLILLLKTKLGIGIMEKLSKRYRALLKIIGYSGIGVGFIGMLFITVVLIQNLYNMIIKKTSQTTVSLVLPGTVIPGLGRIDFSFWIITIFIVALVHEMSHGIIAKAHKIPIKSSGIVFFGPIIGAFVEPDEKKLSKQSDVVKYSVFAAGPFSNIILSLIVLMLTATLVTPIYNNITEEAGVSFTKIQQGYPAEKAGLKTNTIINEINNVTIKNPNDFLMFMVCVKPNQTLTIKSQNKTFHLVTTTNPEDKNRGYIGVVGLKAERIPKKGFETLFEIINWLRKLFNFIIVLSAGIGIFNLLPLGIVDGGRMLKTALESIYGRKALKIWKNISLTILVILILNLTLPILKNILRI